MNNSTLLGCVVMASGNALRFGSNKLLKEFHGKPLIEYALDAIPQGCFSQIAVVTQYQEIAVLAEHRGFQVVLNHQAAEGICASVRLGTKALSECDGILFMVGDQPGLTQSSLQKLIDAFKAQPDHIISAAFSGKRGNPCIFPGQCFAELLALTGDRGGSVVIKRHPELLLLVELSSEELQDIDTLADLNTLTAAI